MPAKTYTPDFPFRPLAVRSFLFSIFYSLLVIGLLPLLACGRPAGFGIGGRYLDAKIEIRKPRGDFNKAVTNLEYVVRRDPFYEDSLTLLGRAYYGSKRYRDAFQILKRALTVNRENEIAWITMGLTQLRLGDDRRGLESIKGGLTLLAKVSKDGYKGLESWDPTGSVRRTLRRAIVITAKGVEEKRKIIRIGEILLVRIDDEEVEGQRDEYNEEFKSGF